MNKLIDAHYFMLPSQGNIYSLAVLNLCSGLNKFIVASLKRKIYSFEYFESSEGILKPYVKELSCTYIPSGAEIISVDAFNKSKTCDDFQIGIAIAKLSAEGNPETYLNIYAEQDLDSNYVLNMDSIAQNCLMVELNFIPYHLAHTSLPSQTSETVWLLSGSDSKIHVFQEDNQNHSYNEVDVAEHFPELINVPSIVLWLDVHHFRNSTRRVSVVGCECGSVQLSIVNSKTNTVLSTYSDVFDGPISQVMLFSLSSKDIVPPDCFYKKEDHDECSSQNIARNDLHLLVCSSMQASVVYMHVEEGFTEKYSLEGSELYDACLCGCAADMNMDGQNEILLGTYGQKILMYKWSGEKWEVNGQRSTANPIHSLQHLDLAGDGVCQLIVHTLSGVHIFQHEPGEVSQLVLKRLKKICNKEEQKNAKKENSSQVGEDIREDEHKKQLTEEV